MASGSQCGFCTPGIVMSLYALLRNDPEPSEAEVEEAFDGNLCRWTGYRPFLDAAQSFSKPVACCKDKDGPNGTDGCCMANGNGGGCCKVGDRNTNPAKQFKAPEFKEYNPDTELIFPPALQRYEMKPLA